jgi:hypothetical protein
VTRAIDDSKPSGVTAPGSVVDDDVDDVDGAPASVEVAVIGLVTDVVGDVTAGVVGPVADGDSSDVVEHAASSSTSGSVQRTCPRLRVDRRARRFAAMTSHRVLLDRPATRGGHGHGV